MIRSYTLSEISPEDILCRDIRNDLKIESTVQDIIDEVRINGDDALRRFTEKFDHVCLDDFEIPRKELQSALGRISAGFRETLETASANIREFHIHQKHENFMITSSEGAVMGQRYLPIARVGIYVPGGTAAYPSTVLMDAIPSKIAGVEELIMTTPPGQEGRVPDAILAAAYIAGVDRVFRIGGAQAVAALAYGTQSIPRVDKIVGPGNAYVAVAKKKVFGQVAIDMIAGPSEILVLADGGAKAGCVAADMLSQAEHDKMATAVLVTDSPSLAAAVQTEIEKQLRTLPREAIARESIETNGKIIVCDDLAKAVEVSNMIAPEHLELCVADPFSILDSIKNAGSVFMGYNVPEALGDYLAGPNHTLPTSGTARFSSPLSVDDFVKKSSFLYYSPGALRNVAGKVAMFAREEGLEAHARSAESRFKED